MTNYITVSQTKPIRDLPLHKNLREMLYYVAETFKDKDAYVIKTRKAAANRPAEYEHISFIRLLRDVRTLGVAFMGLGLKGKRLAIIGNNRYEWMLAYYAQLCGLGDVVPLDKALPEEELETSLARSKADVLVFDKDQEKLVNLIKKSGKTNVKTFICMDDGGNYESIPKLLKAGETASAETGAAYDSLAIDDDAAAEIVFTSGTSANSKAVMLSHRNICYNIWSVLSCEDLHASDVNIAFIPYHHTFGSTGQSMMTAIGMTTVFCDGLKYVQKNLIEYGVSVFICVPLLIEAIYKKLMAEVKRRKKTTAFNMGLKIAAFLEKFGIKARRKIFKDVLDQLGGAIRTIVSGASPLDPGVAQGFADIGINVLQGYGLTETSPVIAAESINHTRPGSIGIAMPNIEVRIKNPDSSGIGELITKSPCVMLGYYEDPQATAETIIDGWLHTGDLAGVDEDGFLYIHGRAKNLIVLKNGKKVFPEEVELLFAALPYVQESFVYGQPRNENGSADDFVLAVKIVYNEEYMQENYPGRTPQEVFAEDLDRVNAKMPAYKHIIRWELTNEPMEKTTTGKVKRYKQNVTK